MWVRRDSGLSCEYGQDKDGWILRIKVEAVSPGFTWKMSVKMIVYECVC